MKEGITKLQAVCRTESLVIVVHQDKELMETVLKLYTTQIERIQEHCKKDEEYNLYRQFYVYACQCRAVNSLFALP
jgi:hypothetical protein